MVKRFWRISALILVDAVLVNLAMYLALILRFDGLANVPATHLTSYYTIVPLFTGALILTFYFTGLYNRLWKYASIGELLAIASAVTMGCVIGVAASYFVNAGTLQFSRGVFVLAWLLNIFLIGGSRLGWRLFRDYGLKMGPAKGGKPVLIVGAGDAGAMVAKELKNHYNGQINLVGFIDDDPSKKKLQILGRPVFGGREKIPDLVKYHGVQEIILAIPSAEGKVIREIVNICYKTEAHVRTIPGMYDLLEGNVTINQIREVKVEDLLGRAPVEVDLASISQYLKEEVVLITGGGGSIGSELCRQVASFSPKKLLLLDVCENNVYDIEMELSGSFPNLDIYPIVKDVRDEQAIEQVFKLHNPKVVFHAAAHKHVPLMEANPEEAIKNNVRGTYNVASAADKYGAGKFVLVSTDKAVNPTSIMGASKRVAEMVIQHLDSVSATNFVAVRFGNVLGSRGSVVPLFKKQIAEGGPVTVTHEDMVRYFMTIPEAVQLIIQAGTMAKGGEIFVLDMGEPVRIMDLAESLIRLSGFEPGEDIEIIVTGIRPGEKLYEELLTDEEGVNATNHKRIFVAKPHDINGKLIEERVNNLRKGITPRNKYETEGFLQTFLPEFRSKESEMTG